MLVFIGVKKQAAKAAKTVKYGSNVEGIVLIRHIHPLNILKNI